MVDNIIIFIIKIRKLRIRVLADVLDTYRETEPISYILIFIFNVYIREIYYKKFVHMIKKGDNSQGFQDELASWNPGEPMV